jgi:hypothetical protein
VIYILNLSSTIDLHIVLEDHVVPMETLGNGKEQVCVCVCVID